MSRTLEQEEHDVRAPRTDLGRRPRRTTGRRRTAAYVDPDIRDDFDRFVGEREAWRAERNRSMGLPEGDELVHALFGEEMVDLYTVRRR